MTTKEDNPDQEANDADIVMRCIDCDYLLDHLQTSCCPECGRVFDPRDRHSFRAELVVQNRSRRALRTAVGLWTAGAVCFVLGIGINRVGIPHIIGMPWELAYLPAVLLYLASTGVVVYATRLVSSWKHAIGLTIIAIGLMPCAGIGSLFAATLLNAEMDELVAMNFAARQRET